MASGALRQLPEDRGYAARTLAATLAGFLVPAVLLLASACASIVLAKTDILNEIALKKLAICNSSEFYDMWVRVPVEPLLKFYVFNYTNLDAVKTGRDKKFRVEEVGPYTYKEFTEKVNIEFNDDGTVTYQENRSYVFVPELSAGTEDDIIISPKITLISAASMLPNMNLLMHLATSLVLHTTSTFLTQRLRDFLWVGDDELLTFGAKVMEGKPFDNFGIFSSRTGVSRHRITVHTGQHDASKLGLVSRIDDRSSLDAWGNAECDRIDGSTGMVFPVGSVSPLRPLYIFNPDLCRRLPLTFQRHVQTRTGIPLLRFETPPDVFDTPERNPDNECYCRAQPDACTRAGVFNNSPCTMGAPIMLSFPHFYLGDPALREVVHGLQPDPLKHHTYVDIHEALGIPLAGKSRFQINVAVQKGSDIFLLEEFQDGVIVPIVWFELGVSELPDELENMMYHVTFSLQRVQVLLGVAALVMAMASGTCLVQRMLRVSARRCHEDAGHSTLLGSFSLRRPA